MKRVLAWIVMYAVYIVLGVAAGFVATMIAGQVSGNAAAVVLIVLSAAAMYFITVLAVKASESVYPSNSGGRYLVYGVLLIVIGVFGLSGYEIGTAIAQLVNGFIILFVSSRVINKSKNLLKSVNKAGSRGAEAYHQNENVFESSKEEFFKNVQGQAGSFGIGISNDICEEIYSIDQTFLLYGKLAGIRRMRAFEDEIVNTITVENLAQVSVLYAFICGLMVPFGNLEKAESDEISKSFVERVQPIAMKMISENQRDS